MTARAPRRSGITETDVLAALDEPRTAMELSATFPGPAVRNYERVRVRLLALERKGLVHRLPSAKRRDQRRSRRAQ
jgi:hypothetical protein